MKKLFLMSAFVLAALFSVGPVAVAASVTPQAVALEAFRLRNLAPEDSVAVVYVNASRIIESQILSQVLQAVGMDLNALLAQAEITKADCQGASFFFVRVPGMKKADATPLIEVGGVSIIPDRTAAAKFQKAVAAIEKEMAGNADAAKVAVKKVKIDGKDAITLEDAAEKISFCMIQTSDSDIQFRVFIGIQPVFALLPFRGTPIGLATRLDTGKMLSFAVDVDAVRKLAGAEDGQVEDPTLAAIHKATLSVSEDAGALNVDAVIASDAGNVKQLQTTCQSMLDTLKQNPEFAPALEKASVKAVGADVRIKASLPAAVISGMVQSALLGGMAGGEIEEEEIEVEDEEE